MSSFAVRMHSKMPLGLKTLIFQMVHKFKFNICRKGVTRHDEELLQCFDKHGLLSICMCVCVYNVYIIYIIYIERDRYIYIEREV